MVVAVALHVALALGLPRGGERAPTGQIVPVTVVVTERAAHHEGGAAEAAIVEAAAPRRLGRAPGALPQAPHEPVRSDEPAAHSAARDERAGPAAEGAAAVPPVAVGAGATAAGPPTGANVPGATTGAASGAGTANGGGPGAGAGAGPGRGAGTGAGAGLGAGAGSGRGDLASRIADMIRSHRRYPALARRRGIEGTVGLALAIDDDGSVHVEVVRSADPMLDDAAREAVLAAAPLPVVHGPLTIDLEFRLLDED